MKLIRTERDYTGATDCNMSGAAGFLVCRIREMEILFICRLLIKIGKHATAATLKLQNYRLHIWIGYRLITASFVNYLVH